MAATFASTLLGLGREIINARYYGTQLEMDAFLAAATIPTILFGIFNGALMQAFLPVFRDALERHDEGDAWRLASTVINTLVIALGIAAVLGWVFAPYYVPLVAHGFRPSEMALTVKMTRWLIPSIIATSLGGVLSAILNAHHRFVAAALTGFAINVVTIACVVALNPRLGIFALVLGTALGLAAQLLVQLPAVIAMRRYRFVIDLRHPGLQKLWNMIGPVIIGSAAGQVALFFDRYFASSLSPGYMAGMNYANKLVNFPQSIFAAAIATVIFPLLAAQFAADNRVGVRRSTAMGLRLVLFITIPSVCGLVALSIPIIQVLFERGAFQASATQLCAGLLPFAAFGLVGTAASIVLTRCSYACHESRWPVAISIITILTNIVLCLIWLPDLGARGLLLANSISNGFQALMLFALVWHLVQGFDWKPIVASAFKVSLASAMMVWALYWIHHLNSGPLPTFLSHFEYMLGQLVIGALVFLAMAHFLNVDELALVWRLILDKFLRHVPSPSENREPPIA